MEEKSKIKISFGTVICLFIIILLVITLVCMYLYYSNKDVNSIVKSDSNADKVAIEEKELYKVSDFELIYNSLVNMEYNNIKEFITSENKIKNISVSAITIYTEDYMNATGIKSSKKTDENTIMGSCVFSIEFENIEGLVLAGSKGKIHNITGNRLTDEKEFIFDVSTGKIELSTSLYLEKEDNTTSQEQSDFELVYNALQNTNLNNMTDYYQKGKIKKITVNSIDIWKENEYAKALNVYIPQEYKNNDNVIIGYCEYTVEFENIGAVEFAGAKGKISKTIGNSYVDDKMFVYDKTTNKLELCTGF